MCTKQEIILSNDREGKSQRQISRDLGISRKTVKKYLDEHLSKELSTYSGNLCVPPKYGTPNRGLRRLSDSIKKQIDALLSDNAKKRAIGMYKQQLKKIDIYGYLKDQGHTIGYTTVCNYIRSKEKGEHSTRGFYPSAL